ncbi:MAG TPA: radical SAM protein, partial [Kofleriaceae bacterium]|nr:radical SAM protein [Kofleriaceae bacterium]
VLHGIGESLLNPALPEITALVKQRGANAVMNSNGTVANRDRHERLVAAGLDELRISIDAGTAETYAQIRGSDRFDRVQHNVAMVAAIKRALGVDTPRVSLWVTGIDANIQELPMVVQLAHDLGVREVYLQRLVTSERGLAIHAQSLVRRRDHAGAVIQKAAALAEQLGVALRGSGNTAGADVTISSVDEARESWRGCRRPWTLVYVTANGNVLSCCIAPFTGVPHEALVLGNVFEQPLETIWHGASYETWRAAMHSSAPPLPCQRCGRDWSL